MQRHLRSVEVSQFATLDRVVFHPVTVCESNGKVTSTNVIDGKLLP